MKTEVKVMARAYGKAAKHAIMNWEAMQKMIKEAIESGKPKTFIYMSKDGAAEITIKPFGAKS